MGSPAASASRTLFWTPRARSRGAAATADCHKYGWTSGTAPVLFYGSSDNNSGCASGWDTPGIWIKNPTGALNAFLSLNKAVKRAPTQAALKQILPLFKAGTSQYGHVDFGDLNKLSAFLLKNKLIAKAVPAATAATNAFVPK